MDVSPSRTDVSDDEDGQNAVVEAISPILIAIRSSFLAFVFAVGVCLLLVSLLYSQYVLAGVWNGILSAMAFVCAVSAFVYAIVGHIGLKLIGYH